MKKRIFLVACASIMLTCTACGAVETGQIAESETATSVNTDTPKTK
jgi:hypothetical protein